MDLLYFDNAGTSWPKPEETQAAMNRYLREIGGSPGRSGNRLYIEAGRIILEAREARVTCGAERFTDWEEAKRRIREATS